MLISYRYLFEKKLPLYWTNERNFLGVWLP